ncbi:MAG TPA: hypothetical protein VKA15_22195 [Isosphaeraceae bacterium]|nr:hypothetical protein [Isosphaeraceae bacterium]
MFDARSILIRRLIGPLWARWERSPYVVHYRHLKRTQFDPPQTIRPRQLQTLQSLLRHAQETTSFYERRFAEIGFRPDDLRSLEDLARFPVLTKADIRNHGPEMIANTHDRRKLVSKATSGSTGVPLEVFADESCMQFRRACTLRSDEWSGWSWGERILLLWGGQGRCDWRGRLRNALLERIYYLDTLQVTDETLTTCLEAARRQPPSLLLGHAHSLYLLADYARSHGGPGFQPRGIISTAMVLHDWQRRAIEEVFGCKVTNRYGCEEVSLIASECEQHDGLHINADGIYLEILSPDGQPAPPGEAGAVVVTDLANRAMPIIRYQIGDMAVLSERACPCGRGLPLLERVEGRVADYIVTPSGRLVSGISLTDHFATLVPGLVQLQMVQETIDSLRFRIVRGPDFGSDSLDRIAQLVKEWFGTEIHYECEFVEKIPQEPSGKYRFCISKVDKNALFQFSSSRIS